MNVEDVKKALGEFADDFNFEVKGNIIEAKARHFIPDREAYSEIGRRMRTVNAEYVKEGKITVWRIPVGNMEANPKLSLAVNHIQKAQQLMIQALEELKAAGY